MPEYLGLLRCDTCKRLDAPPRQYCAECGNGDLVTVPSTGRGTLATWTVIRKPPAAFADLQKYAVAVVDLDDGVRVTGRLWTFDPPPPLGAKVRIADMMDGVPIFAEAPK